MCVQRHLIVLIILMTFDIGTAVPCYDAARDCYYNNLRRCSGTSIYRGNKSHTVNGHACHDWSEHSNAGQKNYCSNPDAYHGPWCYITHPGVRWELCFKDCSAPPANCYDATRNCYHNNDRRCSGVGHYTGSRNYTVNGQTCQEWDVQLPHGHSRSGAGPESYCRNPDGGPGPWCYTINPKLRWELCFEDCSNDIQCYDDSKECYHNNDYNCDREDSYVGTWSYAKGDEECLKWENQIVKRGHRKYNGPENYCRSYDGKGPWCYIRPYTIGEPWDNWENCFETCPVIDCEKPPPLKNGYWNAEKDIGQQRIGWIVYYECPDTHGLAIGDELILNPTKPLEATCMWYKRYDLDITKYHCKNLTVYDECQVVCIKSTVWGLAEAIEAKDVPGSEAYCKGLGESLYCMNYLCEAEFRNDNDMCKAMEDIYATCDTKGYLNPELKLNMTCI